MKVKFLLLAILSLASTLSFAECGMDRKLELIERLNEVISEKNEILSESRNDKRTELRLKSLNQQERELRYEYEVVCNVN
jgi:predicted metalloprotease